MPGPDPVPSDAAHRATLEPYPCFQLYLGWRLAQAFYKPLLEPGTNPQRLYVLTLIDRHGEPTVGEIARGLGLDLGTTSALLSRMEREDLVERRRSDDQRTIVRLRMTRAGRALLRRASREIEAADRRLMDEVDAEDVAALRRVVATLGRLVAAEGGR